MARLLSLLVLIAAAAVFPSAPASAETRRIILHQQADYHGSDYEMLRGIGLDGCQSACLADPDCRAFTHNTVAQVCFLKSQPGELTPFAGAVAGHGWSPARCIPHGGHQMSLNIAAGLGLGGNESYPDLFQPYGGFPDGVRVEDGYVTMPDLPGIGFEGKSDLYAEMKALASGGNAG